ncbi:MAG: LON peptidase substrate-binding domain-containing protein [Acidimicrobiia bacterium]
MAAPTELPMFPLGSVLVPGQVLALQVFEPRYRALVETCLEADGSFGVVLIERGREVGGGDVRFEVGTAARIDQLASTPDGRYLMTAVGTDRFRVVEWLAEAPYPRARVELLAAAEIEADALARRAAVAAGLDRVLAAARALGVEVPDAIELADDPVQAGWDAVAMAPVGPLDVLAILREDDPVARLDLVVAALEGAVEILESRLI